MTDSELEFPGPGAELPDNSEEFLLHSKDGQVLPLLQN